MKRYTIINEKNLDHTILRATGTNHVLNSKLAEIIGWLKRAVREDIHTESKWISLVDLSEFTDTNMDVASQICKKYGIKSEWFEIRAAFEMKKKIYVMNFPCDDMERDVNMVFNYALQARRDNNIRDYLHLSHGVSWRSVKKKAEAWFKETYDRAVARENYTYELVTRTHDVILENDDGSKWFATSSERTMQSDHFAFRGMCPYLKEMFPPFFPHTFILCDKDEEVVAFLSVSRDLVIDIRSWDEKPIDEKTRNKATELLRKVTTNLFLRNDIALKYEDTGTYGGKGGTIFHMRNGRLHREDGPAWEDEYGQHFWFRDGVIHREDGPAIQKDRYQDIWYTNGFVNRVNGPAIKFSDTGDGIYYINGILTNEEGLKNAMKTEEERSVDTMVDEIFSKPPRREMFLDYMDALRVCIGDMESFMFRSEFGGYVVCNAAYYSKYDEVQFATRAFMGERISLHSKTNVYDHAVNLVEDEGMKITDDVIETVGKIALTDPIRMRKKEKDGKLTDDEKEALEIIKNQEESFIEALYDRTHIDNTIFRIKDNLWCYGPIECEMRDGTKKTYSTIDDVMSVFMMGLSNAIGFIDEEKIEDEKENAWFQACKRMAQKSLDNIMEWKNNGYEEVEKKMKL